MWHRLASSCSLACQERMLSRASGKGTEQRASDHRYGKSFFISQSMDMLPWISCSSNFYFWTRGQARRELTCLGLGGCVFSWGKWSWSSLSLQSQMEALGPSLSQPHTHAAHLDRHSTCLQITSIFCLVQQQLFTLPRDVIRPWEFTCAYYELSCVLSWCFISVAVITYIYIKIWYQLFG